MAGSRRMTVILVAVATVSLACVPGATPPKHVGVGGVTPSALTPRQVLTRDIDHPPPLDCTNWRYNAPDPAQLPKDYGNDPKDYRATSARAGDSLGSPALLCGQRGPAVDLAWSVTRGSSEVSIAVLDSGIKWHDKNAMKDLATKVHLNVGELPKPEACADYDYNHDGVFNIADYANDSRVTDRNGNGLLDPEDLILDPQFSDHTDADHNGYVDDIAGWNMLQSNNDPLDDVEYGHGTGEARDSTAADGNGGDLGVCPDCMVIPVKVGDSFIADGGRFAAGVLFALDSGASIIQEALGAISNPPQAQKAIDSAYRRGVPIVASMADEASKHPNLPAAMNHTIPVNSVTNVAGPLDSIDTPFADSDYLSLNGCTNYGGITWVTVPSGACSSEATGRAAGMVGLIETAARGSNVAPSPSIQGWTPGRNVLSANEVAQILRGTADDVDFATPHPGVDVPNDPGVPGFDRYPTSPGWDATFGFGRVNTYEAVRATAAGEIPPEADISGPSWFDVLPATGSVDVSGSVAANRSSSYSYKVQWTTGLQPPRSPGNDTWHTIAEQSGQTAPASGPLASLDLAQVAAALPNGAKGGSVTNGKSDEDRFAVRVRIVVTDAEGRTGVAQRQVFVHDDPDLVAFRRIPGIGANSPVFANVDGKGADELVVGTDDGVVHAFDTSGHDIPGWPVTTPVASFWHAGSPTAIADGIPTPHEVIGVGAPITADLDGDGSMEVAVADGGGHVSIWNSNGTLRSRMEVNPDYSQESATDPLNRLKHGFLASPAAGDLDGDGQPEIVAAALDRHVYAWHLDGTPVAGFPVLLIDPKEAKAVDPHSHAITFRDPDHTELGGELIVTPALGDLNHDGKDEIVVGAQESYSEPVAVFPPIGLSGVSGNARAYAIWGDGTQHAADPGAPATADPDANAYMPGWPVKLAMIKNGILPLVGDGVNTQAAIGDVTNSGHPQVTITSAGGPVYVLDADGKVPYLKDVVSLQIALDFFGSPIGPMANSHDGGVVASAFGGPALGNLDGGVGRDVAVPTVGIGRALDNLLPGHQTGDTQLMGWDGMTHTPLPGLPHRTTDLAFFITPAIVDVDGDGRPEIVAANGVDLVDAVDSTGRDAPGWPKVTGGWAVGTPGFGNGLGAGGATMAITRRDGVLMIWKTQASASSPGDWSRFGHDGRNSGNVDTPR